MITLFTKNQLLKLFKDLRKDLVISKSEKGNGIVLISNSDNYQLLESLFADNGKFNLIDKTLPFHSYRLYKDIYLYYLIVVKLMKISLKTSNGSVNTYHSQ